MNDIQKIMLGFSYILKAMMLLTIVLAPAFLAMYTRNPSYFWLYTSLLIPLSYAIGDLNEL